MPTDRADPSADLPASAERSDQLSAQRSARAASPESARLAELGERYFATQHRHDPFNATLLGLTDFDDRCGDPSRAASAEAADRFDAIGAELAGFDLAALDEAAQVDHSVLTALARGAGGDARHSLWAANASGQPYISRQGLVFQAIPAMRITDSASADRYTARLAGLAGFFAALGQRYADEAAAGRVPTAMGVRAAIDQLTGYLAVDLDRDALAAPAADGDPKLRAWARAELADSVRPAMARLADRLRADLLPVARPDDRIGIGFIPGGEEGYAAAVARNTTTALTPPQIHQIGLDALAELAPRWSEIGRRVFGDGDFAAVTGRLRTDPALRFRTSAQIVAAVADALARAQAATPDWFPDRQLSGCVIEEINPIDARNGAMAYYRPPTVDGSRPGAHCVLTAEPGERFRFEYEALAFHESVPGHHLQLATAQQLDLPRYRRHLDVEACSFNEGWGLYAEALAEEMGLYSGDLALLGMLSFAALRACRLVIDTGIHHYGWSRQQGIDFMWEHTATPRENVEAEVDRYICWPGQALAYQIGKREIVRLREQARRALGARFDVRAFHGVVLGSGALPLSTLERVVTGWIAETTGAAAPAGDR
ncbi:MAG: DUF885 domain-containing protein [Actinomycetia bacterium]|nr:DUF885 domain-containing protein [Actinomycetes bacterium]